MPDNGTDTYYLMVDDDSLDVGSTVDVEIDGETPPVATEPERINIYDYTEIRDIVDYLGVVTNTLENRTIRLLQVKPNGEVLIDALGHAWCVGWTVTAVLPHSLMFGPDGDRIIDVITRTEREVKDTEGPRRNAYDDVGDHLGAIDPNRSFVEIARRALAAAGVEDIFWYGVGGEFSGVAALALRARPYLGVTAAWTQEIYDHLGSAYVAAFGEPVHPDDIVQAA